MTKITPGLPNTRVVIEEGFKNCPLATCYKMFYEFSVMMTIEGLNNLNTANVTNMKDMFGNCSSLTALDLSGWNTASVTKMTDIFYRCRWLKDIYVGWTHLEIE